MHDDLLIGGGARSDFYRAVFEHSMEAVLLTSPDGCIHAANPAACLLLGRSEDDLRRIGRAGVVDSASPGLAELVARRATEGQARGEVLCIRADGSRFPAEVSSAQFHDDQDQLRTVMILRDLTERNRTLAELAESAAALTASEAKYRSVLMSMAEGLVVQDASGRIVEINRAASDIEGRGDEDMLGHDSDDEQWGAVRADGSPFPGAEHPTMVTLRTGEPQHDVVMGIRRPDGERRWISINSQPVVEREGRRAEAVVATFHDITDRKRAEDEIARYVRQLESSMVETLRAVATMVELRDPYTAGHMQRVGMIASDLAREMGWDDRACRGLELAGMVHDVGKIAIPAELLTKPTRLSPVEQQLIRSHVQWSYDILKDVSFPIPIADIVRQHHERMDGSGYPLGLTGEQILPEARILAVADTLESMAAHRPYRQALGFEAAVAEIRLRRGTTLAADVVDALDRLVVEHGYQLPDPAST